MPGNRELIEWLCGKSLSYSRIGQDDYASHLQQAADALERAEREAAGEALSSGEAVAAVRRVLEIADQRHTRELEADPFDAGFIALKHFTDAVRVALRDHLPAPSPMPSREEVARKIDPGSFDPPPFMSPSIGVYWKDRHASALKKADAILALFGSRAVTTSGSHGIAMPLPDAPDPQAQQASVEAVLTDPHAVHINMLRGGIAKLTPAQIGHLYRGEEAEAVISELRRQNHEAQQDEGER